MKKTQVAKCTMGMDGYLIANQGDINNHLQIDQLHPQVKNSKVPLIGSDNKT